jgi:hypothetical protein
MLVLRMQIVFELAIIILTCALNMSLDFHFDQVSAIPKYLDIHM